MSSSYQDEQIARDYLDYLNSQDGQQEQELVFDFFEKNINFKKGLEILDAGCGNGWLAAKLKTAYPEIEVSGFDLSPGLVEAGKSKYSDLDIKVANMSEELPYGKNSFDVIVANFSLHAVEYQAKAFQQLYAVLKQGGQLLITIPNPYYSYPVGVWKRGLIDRLFFKKPELRLRPYNSFIRQLDKKFNWNDEFTSYFYPLSEQLDNALSAGFKLIKIQEARMAEDSAHFDLKYRLFRYPMILFLQLRKGEK